MSAIQRCNKYRNRFTIAIVMRWTSNFAREIVVEKSENTFTTSSKHYFKHLTFIMQSTLNFDLFIIAKTRQATLRKQRKREKQKKQRRSEQLLAQKQLAQQSESLLLDIDDDDIDVSSTYCHSFQVNQQSFVVFREFQYTVNDQNEMTWYYDELYAFISKFCCQDFVTLCRSLFDVTFDVFAMNKNTISQIKFAQQKLQKKQIEWKFELFCHWWRIEKQAITRIKERISQNLKDRLNDSLESYKDVYFRERIELNDFFNECAYDDIWIFRSKWIDNVMNERNITKRLYSSLSTTIRNNDIERMHIHMRKKIVHIWTKTKTLKQSSEHYLYDEIQRRFCFYYWKSNNWFINMNTIMKISSNQSSSDSKSIDSNYWVRYHVSYRLIVLLH